MADIKNTLSLTDKFTPVIKNTITALDNTLKAMQRVRGFKMSNDFKEAAMSVKIAQESLDAYSAELLHLQNIQSKTSSGFSAMTVALGGFAYSALDYISQVPSKIVGLGDSLLGIEARLKFINDGTRTNAALFDEIYQSAQRARSEFGATADVVAKLGMLAKEAFGSNDEMIAFTETMNKAFVLSGAGEMERTSAMYQLSQAMAAGKLQGDEFRSIMENAPLLAQAIADFTGKSKGELKEMSAEGTITADIIKGALFKASGEINRQFAEMPVTVGQALTVTGNLFKNVFGDTMMNVSTALASSIMFINEHLYEVGMGLAYAGTVAAVMFAPAVWSIASGAAVAAFNFALINAPILAIVATVFIFIDLLLRVPEALGYIVGGIYAIGAAILDAPIALMNTFIVMLNAAIEGLNKLTGKNIDLIQTFDLLDTNEAFKKGYETGNNFAIEVKDKVDSLKNDFQSLKNVGGNTIDPFKIPNENGKIPVTVKGGKLDKVDITSEDLKYLRDVAMHQYKINYKQITPQVNIAFGDVRETADVDVILDQIEQKMVKIYKGDLQEA